MTDVVHDLDCECWVCNPTCDPTRKGPDGYTRTVFRLGGLYLCRSYRHISPDRIWILFESCYMYTAPTFWGLVRTVVREWRDDSNLVG